ncbi:hypothetical protein L596_016597 [Steinernema carpocapsae]|uniref:Uncharacterized protein n=1 Tax=Steinernema carpocapsae TaxID=34508 RepID=A0A4U5NIJ0_STECR|nr:hypothetical protein L596_016597 [Steinernema carpocapsae]
MGVQETRLPDDLTELKQLCSQGSTSDWTIKRFIFPGQIAFEFHIPYSLENGILRCLCYETKNPGITEVMCDSKAGFRSICLYLWDLTLYLRLSNGTLYPMKESIADHPRYDRFLMVPTQKEEVFRFHFALDKDVNTLPEPMKIVDRYVGSASKMYATVRMFAAQGKGLPEFLLKSDVTMSLLQPTTKRRQHALLGPTFAERNTISVTKQFKTAVDRINNRKPGSNEYKLLHYGTMEDIRPKA